MRCFGLVRVSTAGWPPSPGEHGVSYDPQGSSDESLPQRFSVSTPPHSPFLLRSLCACLSFSPFSLICPLVALCSHRLLVCARIGFSLAVASFPLVFRPMPTVLKFVHRLISSLSQSPLGVMRPVALTHGQFHAYMMLILLRATTLVPLSSAWICYMICEGHR